jgi:excisionase family DNA binding protein
MTSTTEKTSVSTEELLTVAEVAKILRCDDTTVRRWVKQGTLDAIVLPHVNERQAYRIRRSTINTLLVPTLLTIGGGQG